MSGQPYELPCLVIELPLESVGRISLVCESHEDELRLRSWLRTSGAFADLTAILGRLLDDLDAVDAESEGAT